LEGSAASEISGNKVIATQDFKRCTDRKKAETLKQEKESQISHTAQHYFNTDTRAHCRFNPYLEKFPDIHTKEVRGKNC
jgi:hypothetical protein